MGEMKENALIHKFVRDQLSQWPLAAANFRALKDVELREAEVGGLMVTMQHNPARSRSTLAKTDKSSVEARPCFLCMENRPAEQRFMPFEGRKGRKYEILVNPYPIFPAHLVVASAGHEPQTIRNRYVDMLDLAHHFTDFTFFYNGPRCGASAPDHLHFQGAPRGLMPLEREADRLLDSLESSGGFSGVPYGEETAGANPDGLEYLTSVQEAQIYHYKKFTRGIFLLRARTSKSMAKLFYRLLDCVPVPEGETEPMFNLLTWYKCRVSGTERPRGNTHGLAPFEYRAIVTLRSAHRPSLYFAEDPDRIAISPGCADMAGLVIVPRGEDFARLESSLLEKIFSEVSPDQEAEEAVVRRLTRRQRTVSVGVMSADEISFEIISDGAGRRKVSCSGGKISYNGDLFDELYFDACTPSSLFAEPSFILYDIPIGIGFHWERRLDRKFAGALKFIVGEGKVIAVNVIGVEDYLLSVISSEMRKDASLEFLKAHAVISRSWLLSMVESREKRVIPDLQPMRLQDVVTELDGRMYRKKRPADGEYVKWFDRSDHRLFDVCADDHCQRYQGLEGETPANVRGAIDATWGLVLRYGDELCDARFSKCCGGRTELFSTCWEDRDYPYLSSVPDTPADGGEPFCASPDRRLLALVLNDYDLETADFYTWRTEYSREYLGRLIRERSGFDFGDILAMVPLDRGPSGRIWRLKIVGSARTMVVGKELIIRKFLSTSHLKSSAFDLHWYGVDGEEIPAAEVEKGSSAWSRVVLEGHGWGHGVGLCQIGAAVMSSRGYGFREILEHYYPGARICR